MKTGKLLALFLLFLAPLSVKAQDPTMLQGFYWNTYPGGTWYDSLAIRAPQLARAGIKSVWFPPPSKGNAGRSDVGYTPYDYFDLGEFDSRGGDQTSGFGAYIPTRYGTYQQLKNAIDQLHANGVEAYMDIVLNHRSGGSPEQNPFIGYYPFSIVDGRYVGWDGSLYTQNDSSFIPPKRVSFTAFPLKNGSGRFASTPGNGGKYVYPNGNINPDNTSDIFGGQWGYFEFYKNTFAYDVALHDWDGNPLPAGDSLIVWGSWLTKRLNLDGYRFDFVKGIHWNYLKRWLDTDAMKGKFSVGELYDGDTGRLKDWLAKMSGTQKQASVFDFNMRFGYKEFSDGGPNYDVRNFNGRGLVNAGAPGDRVVTFVDNHDFDRLDYESKPSGDGHSPVIGGKVLCYAHLLTHPGYATVWYRDYYWYGLRDEINKLLAIRKSFVSGSHEVLTARTDGGNAPYWPGNAAEDAKRVYVMRRYGTGGQTGVLFAMNNSDKYDIEVWVSAFDWSNKKLYDVTGNSSDTLQVYGDNRVLVKTKKNSYHIWVPTDYPSPFVTNAAAFELKGFNKSFIEGDSVQAVFTVENRSTFSKKNVPVSFVLKKDNVEISSKNLVIPFIGGQDFVTLTFPGVKNLKEGNYSATATVSMPGDSEPSDNQKVVNFKVDPKPVIVSFRIDGDLSESFYRMVGNKQNTNAGFGIEKDIKGIFIGSTDDTLYLGIECVLDPSNPNGDGLGLLFGFDKVAGAPAGTPLGNVKGSGHFLQIGDTTYDAKSEAFKMSFEVDFGLSLLAVSQKSVVTLAKYGPSGPVGGAVIANAANGAPIDGSSTVSGPLGSSVFPDKSFRYAYSNAGTGKKGLELAIAKSALGANLDLFRAFGFILSANGYFSNVTVPGTVTGSADAYKNLGFNPDFTKMSGGPFYSCDYSLVTGNFDDDCITVMNPTISVSPKILNLEGSGGETVSGKVKIKNTSGDILNIYSIWTKSNAFTLLPGDPGTIAPHDSLEVTVSFTVPGQMTLTDTLVIQSAASNEPRSLVVINVIGHSGVGVSDRELPQVLALNQNYPNPFNPETKIEFGLPESGHITLRVINLLGQEVSVLVRNEMFSAGWHQVTFSAASLPSGIYFYKLESGSKAIVNKMTVVK
ncbi:MAG: T9SS type A sorting domain-containing protein [Bacteroidetes bacterium]|nr:T9SS type A sorting domain-containing protein [Bacteroidota bacterium]